MKLGKWCTGIVALALCSLSTTAHAVKVFTVTGTISPDQYGNGSFLFRSPAMDNYTTVTSGFRWGLTASFSQPVTGTMIAESECGYCWYILNRYTGETLDANDGVVFMQHDFNNTTFAKTTASIEPYVQGWHVYGRAAINAAVYMGLTNLTSPVQYTMSGFNSVPEPSTWALMILGFGGIGTALRRQKTKTLSIV